MPARKVREHRVWQVDGDDIIGREASAPFFDAGGVSLAIAELPNHQGGLHIPKCHRFWLILQGEMQVRLDRDTVVATAGDLVCMPAGVKTQRTGLGPLVAIYVEIADTPAWTPLKTRGPSIRQYESTPLAYALVDSIARAPRSQDIYSMRCSRENAAMLVTLLKRELHQSTNEGDSGCMKRLADLLENIRETPDAKWDRQAMARMVNMSERNLGRVFKRVFGMPPTKMVITVRMDAASRLLRKTDMTLSAIANAVGYDSAFSFSRLFSKYAGISPAQYRSLPAGKRLRVPFTELKPDLRAADSPKLVDERNQR